MSYLLAIDQGTTNSRAIIFNKAGERIAQHELTLKQFFPENGWVEQNPLEIVQNTIACCREALKKAGLDAKAIAAVGISNQRETTIVWDKHSGKPIYPAIVWQDRRTSEICKTLTPYKDAITAKTGLLLDPYFSATKIMWLLENVPHARERAERGELLFGTVDTFLIWNLTKNKDHVTDITNASRTLLFNIKTQEWDKEILQQLHISSRLLPTVLDNTAHFGDMDASILGISIPITGVAGDQQAATIGQACFKAGMIKATYGTGCFMLLNTGPQLIYSRNHLLSTIVYRINNQTAYGLEGCIFSAGTTIKWLRDTLKLIQTASETESIAENIKTTNGVYLIPAFTGLGAPYWDPEARGAILGLTRDSNRDHIVRAALESVGYQSKDLLQAMLEDYPFDLKTLRVDGGMAANNWLLQFLADILNITVQRPKCIETSALGAAYLAGLQIGMFSSLEEIATQWQMNAEFSAKMPTDQRDQLYKNWKRAVHRIMDSSHQL